MKSPRPLSITIIAWYLILTSSSSLLLFPANYSNPLVVTLKSYAIVPIYILDSITILSLIVTITSGIGMLNRLNWARLLYLFYTPVNLLITISIYDFKLLGMHSISAIIISIFIYFLTRVNAIQYFTNSEFEIQNEIQTKSRPPFSKPSPGKLILSLVLFFCGYGCINSWAVSIKTASNDSTSSVIFSFLFLALSSAFIIPAIKIWGMHPWKRVFGYFLLLYGILSTITGVILFSFTGSNPIFKFKNTSPEMINDIAISLLIIGISFSLIGFLLVYYQKLSDLEINKTINT